MGHTFHIPVMGLAFSIDTPLYVAPYGISSVVSIVDDELIERMRCYHCQQNQRSYAPITKAEPDSRARRITAYLDLLQELVEEKIQAMRKEPLEEGTSLWRYLSLLPESDPIRSLGLSCSEIADDKLRSAIREQLLERLVTGCIDVNIMAKVDKLNPVKTGEDEKANSDALIALRGYAKSRLRSSLVLSAGMNPSLYQYLAQFEDFFPDEQGELKKQVILKVSDFRSASIQARFLAKKGIWVSEFRIESGLNCGGHAFATAGYLMGPILEEFKQKRGALYEEVFESLKQALEDMGRNCPETLPIRFTAQGGIGTHAEQEFLLQYYQLDAVGWGSPFLLVPEVTNVDAETLLQLVLADPEDFYVSDASPLGVPFNNFRKSSAEQQRLMRIAKGRPGAPCTKKYLISNTEFGPIPLCTASRTYQVLKLKQLQGLSLAETDYRQQVEEVLAKTCLCEGLATSAYLKKGILKPKESKAVAICPGPNLIWFSGPYTLQELVDHIYGRVQLIDWKKRPNLFINELGLYLEHFARMVSKNAGLLTKKEKQYREAFKKELLEGIQYYKDLLAVLKNYPAFNSEQMQSQLEEALAKLGGMDKGIALASPRGGLQ